MHAHVASRRHRVERRLSTANAIARVARGNGYARPRWAESSLHKQIPLRIPRSSLVSRSCVFTYSHLPVKVCDPTSFLRTCTSARPVRLINDIAVRTYAGTRIVTWKRWRNRYVEETEFYSIRRLLGICLCRRVDSSMTHSTSANLKQICARGKRH